MDVGGLIINAGFYAAAAYVPLQLYTLIKWDGRWRRFAAVALVVMLPVIAWTAVGFAQEKNLWPLVLLFVSPFASMYLLILMFCREMPSPETVPVERKKFSDELGTAR